MSALILSKNSDFGKNFAKVSHSSNGSENLSSFTESNKDNSQLRVEGLVVSIHKEERLRIFYNNNGGINPTFYTKFPQNNSIENDENFTEDYEHRFKWENNKLILSKTRFRDSDFDGVNYNSPANLYQITLKIKDASALTGHKESFFKLWVIITKLNISPLV